MLDRRITGLVVAFLLVFSGWANANNEFSDVFVFGDSLSDTGNLASVIGDFPDPPYYMGSRVSNGPVAVEVLAERLGLDAAASLHLLGPGTGTNYAVAGARAIGIEPIDLDTQLTLFLANQGFVAPADALYVVFLGGNDIRDARDSADFRVARDIVKAAAGRIGETIESLAAAGARNFLLVNAPNIGTIPETRLIADLSGNTYLVEQAERLSKLYRRQLHRIAERLEDNDNDYGNSIEIVEFDLYKFFQKLLRKGDKLGFTNTTDPCFSPTLFPAYLGFNPDCNFGANFDQFVFFDEIHPTARAHALAGEAMFEALQDYADDQEHNDKERHERGRKAGPGHSFQRSRF